MAALRAAIGNDVDVTNASLEESQKMKSFASDRFLMSAEPETYSADVDAAEAAARALVGDLERDGVRK
jgi:hypothetical protein